MAGGNVIGVEVLMLWLSICELINLRAGLEPAPSDRCSLWVSTAVRETVIECSCWSSAEGSCEVLCFLKNIQA